MEKEYINQIDLSEEDIEFLLENEEACSEFLDELMDSL